MTTPPPPDDDGLVVITDDLLEHATPEEMRRYLAYLEAQSHDWRSIRRADQIPPDGDWFIWLILAGRGWGKTRTGAELAADEDLPLLLAHVRRAADRAEILAHQARAVLPSPPPNPVRVPVEERLAVWDRRAEEDRREQKAEVRMAAIRGGWTSDQLLASLAAVDVVGPYETRSRAIVAAGGDPGKHATKVLEQAS